MDDVYILLIERSSTYSKIDTHIDSVHSSEKKAWEQIEKRYKTLTKIISKTPLGKIQFAEFHEKSFILGYHTIYNGIIHIKYTIDKRVIH